MPKDKKKERRPSTSDDSDSGPEDKGPAKKAKPTAASGSTPHCSMENGEPTWNLGGGMKFVKVRYQCDIQKKCENVQQTEYFGYYTVHFFT